MALTVDDASEVRGLAQIEVAAALTAAIAELERLPVVGAAVVHNGEPLLRVSDVVAVFQCAIDTCMGGSGS